MSEKTLIEVARDFYDEITRQQFSTWWHCDQVTELKTKFDAAYADMERQRDEYKKNLDAVSSENTNLRAQLHTALQREQAAVKRAEDAERKYTTRQVCDGCKNYDLDEIFYPCADCYRYKSRMYTDNYTPADSAEGR